MDLIVDARPEDHNHPGMLSHDLPAVCPNGCGWLETMCHCGLDMTLVLH